MNIDLSYLKETLQQGFDISLGDYYNHCKKNTEKTFFFIIKLLSSVEKEKFVESTLIREHIINKLSGVFQINPNFNPEGWFGRSWTEGHLDRTSYFRKIYSDVLDRSETEPYKYRINPEYFEIVKEAFAHLIFNINDKMEVKYYSSDSCFDTKIFEISELVNHPNFPFNTKNCKIRINDLKGIVTEISKSGDSFILFDGKKNRKIKTDFVKSKFG